MFNIYNKGFKKVSNAELIEKEMNQLIMRKFSNL